MPTLRSCFKACLLLVALLPLFANAQSDTYALKGTLVTPDQIISNGTLLISKGIIQSAGAGIAIPAGTPVFETGGVIYPGLIDLHNHLTYNVFPRWKPTQEFANRYAWQQKPVYQTLIATPRSMLGAEGLNCELERYAEVKVISEGETSTVGGLYEQCSEGLARNLDYSSGLFPAPTGSEKVYYDVFPMQMDTATATRVLQEMDSGKITSLLIHIAEGAPNDASAAREFAMMKARGFLRPGVSLIHAVALKPDDFAEMATHGVGMVWSPRSNIELYGATANVAAALAAHVKIAIAPDWSPTGSDGLLAELNYAAVWNETQWSPVTTQTPFTDRDLVRMATVIPAQMTGLADKIGSLEPGRVADLLILPDIGKSRGKDAYWTLLHATAADVRLVVIGGAAVYGDEEMMHRMLGGKPQEKLTVCGSAKAVSFASEPQTPGKPRETWQQTVQAIETSLREWGRSLAPLAECSH